MRIATPPLENAGHHIEHDQSQPFQTLSNPFPLLASLTTQHSCRNVLVRTNFLSPHDGFYPPKKETHTTTDGIDGNTIEICGCENGGEVDVEEMKVVCDTMEEVERFIEMEVGRNVDRTPKRRIWGLGGRWKDGANTKGASKGEF